MKALKYILITVGILFAAFVTWGLLYTGDAERFYYLGIVNNSNEAVEVSPSLSTQKITVAPGESKTVKIESQTDKESSIPRKFEVKSPSGIENLEMAVVYHGDIVIDVTGTSCILAVDYGRQFRAKDIALPEGEMDLVFLKKFQGQKIFQVPSFPEANGRFQVAAGTRLGEKLPETIKIDKGQKGLMPTHVRLISVPCESINDVNVLYDFLNGN